MRLERGAYTSSSTITRQKPHEKSPTDVRRIAARMVRGERTPLAPVARRRTDRFRNLGRRDTTPADHRRGRVWSVAIFHCSLSDAGVRRRSIVGRHRRANRSAGAHEARNTSNAAPPSSPRWRCPTESEPTPGTTRSGRVYRALGARTRVRRTNDHSGHERPAAGVARLRRRSGQPPSRRGRRSGRPVGRSSDFLQAMLDFAANVCTARAPACQRCLLEPEYQYADSGSRT